MSQLQNLLNRLSNLFTKDPNSNLSQLLGAVGNQLDQVDPSQTNLEDQFSVSTATGSALDAHGADWGVVRKNGELDNDYRKRIQALVPIYTNGPTVSAISQIVQNFTGVPPIIIEYGPASFTMGVSPMGSFVFSDENNFTFQIQVQNPNGIYYLESDMENAVNFAKPARSTATFIHQHGNVSNSLYAINQGATRGEYLTIGSAITYDRIVIDMEYVNNGDYDFQDFYDDYGTPDEVYMAIHTVDGTFVYDDTSDSYTITSGSFAENTRFTIDMSAPEVHTTSTSGDSCFGTDKVNGRFSTMKLYDVKYYHAGTLVAHFDFTKGTMTDQTGNGNILTATGGGWLNA